MEKFKRRRVYLKKRVAKEGQQKHMRGARMGRTYKVLNVLNVSLSIRNISKIIIGNERKEHKDIYVLVT